MNSGLSARPILIGLASLLLFVLIGLAAFVFASGSGESLSNLLIAAASPTMVPPALTAGASPVLTATPTQVSPSPTATPTDPTQTAVAATMEANLERLRATATVKAGTAQVTATAYAVQPPPPGRLQPHAAFENVWKPYPGGIQSAVAYNHLGWATAPASEVFVAIEPFERWSDGAMCSSQSSLMLWREDLRKIYFLVEGNIGLHAESCRDWWWEYPDTWKEGDPNNQDIEAPPGKVVPIRGFGKVWREFLYKKTPGLGEGFATAPEQGFRALLQPFENGVAILSPQDRTIYVLFDRFDYYTRSGLVQGQKVWFKGQL